MASRQEAEMLEHTWPLVAFVYIAVFTINKDFPIRLENDLRPWAEKMEVIQPMCSLWRSQG